MLETISPIITSKITPPKIFTLGGLGLGGFFGGPLAITYLIYRDLIALELRSKFRIVAIWFTPLILFWIYCIFNFPPDFISQFILHFPQAILWWIVARHLLSSIHRNHISNDGLFRSRWSAVRFGIFTFFSLKIIFFIFGIMNEQ